MVTVQCTQYTHRGIPTVTVALSKPAQMAKMRIPSCLSDMMTLMLHKDGTSLNKGFSVVDPKLLRIHLLSILEP
jgi:hypothetical protein